ncbi:hypothetical protein GS921_00285 [Rhodococcus hoagii]|nr:hypothetical protein [Prescottella equi]
MIEVPEFKTGEPGFTKKLNQLADAVRELQQTGSSPARPVGDGDDFDPADFDVDEVNAYLDGADAAERERVLQAEADGKARKGILSGPHADTSKS